MGFKTKDQANTNNYNKSYAYYCKFATSIGVFFLSFFIAGTLSPVLPSGAITCEDGSTGTAGQVCDTADTSVSVNIENPYYITITNALDKINLDYTVSSVNLGSLLTATDTVTTTSNTGQIKHLYISTASPTSNDLTNSNTEKDNSRTYIAAGGGDTLDTATTLPNDTWGFNTVNNNTFAKVPVLGDDILIQQEIGTEKREAGEYISTQNVTYGTIATADLYAGKYSNTVRYTAFVDEPPKLPTMQDFTVDECKALTEVTEENYDTAKTLLIDVRDNKTYIVGRMKDGNCWMLQNLAYSGGIMTPDDSNVSEERDLRGVVISNRTASEYDTPQIYNAIANRNTNSCSANDVDCVVSDAKYGNLYNWNAATAGVGKQETVGTIYESVCPKGWRLPDSGRTSGLKSYSNLFAAYGLPSNNGVNHRALQAVQGSPFYIPLAAMYSGSISTAVGAMAFLWTRTVVSSNSNIVYSLHLATQSQWGFFDPLRTTGNYKSRGYSVRCVLGE